METQGDDFRKFLINLLGKFMEKDRVIRYTDDEAMKIWHQAFIHESVSITTNYETLEKLGDAVLREKFVIYLMQRFKNINGRIITEMHNIYMSKEYQGELCKRLGLDNWIQTHAITASVYEDIFESFVGALYWISGLKDNYGRSTIICINFIIYLFEKVEIDIKQTAATKTFVIQTLSRLGLGNIIEKAIRSSANNHAYELSISQTAIKFFQGRNIYLPTILGAGMGSTKTEALSNAYNNAYNVLINKGVTDVCVETERHNWEFEAPEFQPYLASAKENLVKMGYNRMYFQIPRNIINDKNGIFIQLIGVKEKTSEHIQLGFVSTLVENTGKKELLMKLAAGNIRI